MKDIIRQYVKALQDVDGWYDLSFSFILYMILNRDRDTSKEDYGRFVDEMYDYDDNLICDEYFDDLCPCFKACIEHIGIKLKIIPDTKMRDKYIHEAAIHRKNTMCDLDKYDIEIPYIQEVYRLIDLETFRMNRYENYPRDKLICSDDDIPWVRTKMDEVEDLCKKYHCPIELCKYFEDSGDDIILIFPSGTKIQKHCDFTYFPSKIIYDCMHCKSRECLQNINYNYNL